MEISHGVYILRNMPIQESILSHEEVNLIVQNILKQYLTALAIQRAPDFSSQPPQDQQFAEFVVLDPSAAEQEILEEGEDAEVKTEKKETSVFWLKTSVVSIRLIFADPQSRSASQSSMLNQEPKELSKNKEPDSLIKETRQSSSLKEAFQKLIQEHPEFSSQFSEISQCFEKQNDSVKKNSQLTKQEAPKFVFTEVKTSLKEMGSKDLVFLAKDLVKDHPSLALRIVKEVVKRCSTEELMNFLEVLKEEHPLLSIEVVKGMKEEMKPALLNQLVEKFSKENPEAALAAAKAMKGSEGQKQLEKLVLLLKENNPSLAFESAKAMFGKEGSKMLSELALQFAKDYPDLAFESAMALRGEDRLENMALLVQQLHKQYPELALKIAHVVEHQARIIPNPEIRNQLLAWLTPPLEIREIKLSANPFAQSFSFRASGVSSSKSRKKKQEEEEEENEGTALFTFYINSPFERDFIQKVEKALLLEGVQIKMTEMKEYEKLLSQLQEEKMGSLFFQQKILIKPPFAPLVHFYIEPLGLYSEKVRTLQELTKESLIVIPKEQKERALLFLEKTGLKECGVQEVETPFLISSLEDFDAVILPSLEAWRFGLRSQSLALESKNSPYLIALAVPAKELEDKEFLFLKKCLESNEMKFYMETEYQGVVIPVF